MTISDLPAILAIERRSFPAPWSPAMFVSELAKPSGTCLCAELDGRVVGYLVCSRLDTVWHVMNVSVDPDRRRTGIATRLLRRLFAELDPPGATYTLEVRVSNDGAIAMYAGQGFAIAGVRPRYYADNREDAAIMWRSTDPAFTPPNPGIPWARQARGRR